MMSKEAMQKLIEVITDSAIPLQEQNEDYEALLDKIGDALLDKIGDARFVMIGEASHGTHEFYQARIKITQRLIKERGFMAVAIEGDWPDAYHVHRYLQGIGGSNDAERSLDRFKRFPTWMWRNTTMPPFLSWLRTYNDKVTSPAQKIGFYGLDLYSLNASIEAVIHFLMKIDPEAARRAQERYSCFDHVNIEPQMYGYLINAGIKKSCINETIAELIELQHRSFEYLRHDGISADEYFFATQNARLVKNAENYYRSMLEGQVTSWNIRDRHMAETLNILVDHLETRCNKPAKVIIWAHNSHIGGARATEMSERGEVNIGQLVREQYATHSYPIGFSTYEGFVTAASDWDAPIQRKKVMPGLPGSYEEFFLEFNG